MVAAARSAGGKAAAAAAANDVYEAELDRVLELGWAHADRASFDAFAAELASAPASAKGALQVLDVIRDVTNRIPGLTSLLLGLICFSPRLLPPCAQCCACFTNLRLQCIVPHMPKFRASVVPPRFHDDFVLLQLLCSLYGLTRLERNSGFYLGAGALDSRTISSVREHVNAACALLSAKKGALALRLCDGFGVPDHLIAAPIAQDWRRIVT